MTDVFAIQDEIAQAIAGKLRVHLIADRPLVKKSMQNMEAYNLYLKGRYHYFKSTPESVAKSKEYYEQAIAVDPNCVKAWSGLAFVYWTLGFGGLMPAKAANAKSSQAVLKALELDEMLPEAHSVFAVLRAGEFDWKGAEREFDRALQLGPEVSDVWWQYSQWYLVPMNLLDEAVAAAQKALELDPLSPYVHFQLGLRYFMNQQYDLAIQQHRNVLELDPHFFGPYVQLGVVYIQTGNINEAISTSEKAVQLGGTLSPLLLAFRGFVKAQTGQISEAQQLLDELQELAQQKHVPAVAFAMVYFGLGEIDKCFDWLDRGVDERDAMILQIHRAPNWNPLRSHSRYKALLKKMNLEP
jgi:tetratricopeptide (TPR) repeat protein